MISTPRVLLICLCALLWVGTARAAAANFTWTGAAGTELWSTPGDWQGDAAPSGSVGTVTFPASACSPPAVCVASIDTPDVSMNALSVDDGTPYVIKPDAQGDTTENLMIGSGGITAGTQATIAPGANTTPVLGPVDLTAAQTWTIDGGPSDAGALSVDQLSGGYGLGVDLSDQAVLTVAGDGVDNEPGPVTLTGADSADTGAAAVDNGSLGFSSNGGELDTASGDSIAVDDAALVGPATVGPLTVTGGLVAFKPGSPIGVITVDGGAQFGAGTLIDLPLVATGAQPPTAPAGNDYAQMNVDGQVTLAGAALNLVPSPADSCPTGNVEPCTGTASACPSLSAGDVDTILTASGGISGTFSGLPDGSVLTLDCVGQQPTVKLSYSADSLTATVESAGGPAYPTAIELSGPTSPVTAGQSVTLTASVSSEVATYSDPTGTLTFLQDGQAISGCSGLPLSSSLAETPTAVCHTSADAGSHTVTARFTSSSTEWASGTSNSLTLSTGVAAPSPVPATAAPIDTSLRLSAGADVGDPELLEYSVTVTRASGAAGDVSGLVRFYDGATVIPGCSSVKLSAGRANCVTGYQLPGAQTITAVYLGADGFAQSLARTVAHSRLTVSTVRLGNLTSRRPTLSLRFSSAALAFSGWRLKFTTAGVSLEGRLSRLIRVTERTPETDRVSLSGGALVVALERSSRSSALTLGPGALRFGATVPRTGSISAVLTVAFPHRPSAEIVLSIRR